jgi:ferredoxin-NADP reductase
VITKSADKTPKIEVEVTRIQEVSDIIKRFTFTPVDGTPLPVYGGGAHIVVEMQDGDVLRRNPYSLVSKPGTTQNYQISVRRDDVGRGGSLFMHNKLNVGDHLLVSHPVNLFPIDRRARKHLLIAGGIGITPFLAMMAELEDESANFELHLSVRTDGAFLDELRGLYGAKGSFYRDDQNEVIPLADLLSGQPLGTHLYVCGPSGMLDWVLRTAESAGWPSQNVHYERFLAPPIGEPYEVQLATSAITVKVGGHQSMLEAIEAAGVDAPYLCRGGACGQCETRVISYDGELLHNDHFLTDEEHASGTKIMPCVSRFQGRELVLDR